MLTGMLLACSSGDDTSGSPAAAACTPGQQYACSCTTGAQSTQICNADGESLSPCVCESAPPAGGGGSGGALVSTGGVSTGGALLTGGTTASGGTVATGGTTPATGGISAAGAGTGGGTGGTPTTTLPEGIPSDTSCTGMTLPAVTDYGAMGPFATIRIDNTGPDGNYTMFRPETLGGANGFMHPPLTWGNGILTTPDAYVILLNTIASHGFVVIASNSTSVNTTLMTAGLDWLIGQNTSAGDLQGKLAVNCAVSIGYSLGGGAAVDTGKHPNVVTTVSFHGLQGTAELLHGPLFLLTSTNDGFVTKSGYVQPTYDRSTVVPTLMATLEIPGAVPDNNGHLIPLNDAGQERAPAVAWLRYWVYDDQGAHHWFYGNDCVLCQTPWVDIQRKNANWQ